MDNTWWRKANELDDDQREIIELELDGNYLVVGPPGCGKTNILLLRASYLRSAGLQNCLVLTYTRTLKEFISSGGKIPDTWIKTFNSWGKGFLRSRGRADVQFDDKASEPVVRQLLLNALEGEADSHSNPKGFYDSILIDEVQDYTAQEIALLARFTERLYVVGDERQRIYAAQGGIKAASDAGCIQKTLRNHYRIGHRICEVADKLSPATPTLRGTSQYDEDTYKSEVRVHTGNLDQQLTQMGTLLRTQIRAFPGQWFGVFAAKWDTIADVERYLEAEGFRGRYKVQRQGEDRSFDPEIPICVMTIASAKGAEFRGVHLIAADVFPYYTREKAFTAATRAKTTLDIYHSGDMDPSLQTALAVRRVPKLDLEGA